MMLLHGCTQTPADFAAATRFTQLADRQGCILLLPQQTAAFNLQRCWNWFDARHQARAAGEPAVLAGIAQRVAAEQVRWRVDGARIYVGGISAGGAMALTLGATYPDVFAGIAVHSAPPYASANSSSGALGAMAGRGSLVMATLPSPSATAIKGLVPPRSMPPVIVFQGTADVTVRPINAANVTAQWLEFRKAAVARPFDPDRVTRTKASSSRVGGRTSTVNRWYSARGKTCLESWLVHGLGHAWSGGLKDASFSDPAGPRATTIMWRFLANHTLSNG